MSGIVDDLKTLTALLDMTNEAWALASEMEKPERLKQLVLDLRNKAKAERKQIKRDQIGKRFDLCMIGILEELNSLDRVPEKIAIRLDLKLMRIRGEIERTIVEVKDRRKIM